MELTSDKDTFFAKITIVGSANQDLEALVDTGASSTLVDNDKCIDAGLRFLGVADRLCVHGDSKPLPLYNGGIKIADYSNNAARIFGLPPIEIDNKRIEGILGRDIMSNFKLIIDWKTSTGQLER